MNYCMSNSAYNGHFFFTAEYLLRGVIKVLLSVAGFEDVWRDELSRDIASAMNGGDFRAQENH